MNRSSDACIPVRPDVELRGDVRGHDAQHERLIALIGQFVLGRLLTEVAHDAAAMIEGERLAEFGKLVEQFCALGLGHGFPILCAGGGDMGRITNLVI